MDSIKEIFLCIFYSKDTAPERLMQKAKQLCREGAIVRATAGQYIFETCH